MSVATLTLCNLINEYRYEHCDGFAIFLDIAAAFDSVRRKTIYQLLNYIFPESDFSELIQNVASGSTTSVFDNGCDGEIFDLTKEIVRETTSSPKTI